MKESKPKKVAPVLEENTDTGSASLSRLPAGEALQVTTAYPDCTYYITRKKDTASLFYLYKKVGTGQYQKIGKGEKTPDAFSCIVFKIKKY